MRVQQRPFFGVVYLCGFWCAFMGGLHDSSMNWLPSVMLKGTLTESVTIVEVMYWRPSIPQVPAGSITVSCRAPDFTSAGLHW